MVGIHKILARIANREDTDQAASSEAVWSGSALFVYHRPFLQAASVQKFRTSTVVVRIPKIINLVDLFFQRQEAAGKKQITVLDPKRSNAINIGLTVLPPPRTIKAAILKMDTSIMNREGIEVSYSPLFGFTLWSNAINIGLTVLPPPRTIKAAILKMDTSIMNREGIEVSYLPL